MKNPTGRFRRSPMQVSLRINKAILERKESIRGLENYIGINKSAESLADEKRELLMHEKRLKKLQELDRKALAKIKTN